MERRSVEDQWALACAWQSLLVNVFVKLHAACGGESAEWMIRYSKLLIDLLNAKVCLRVQIDDVSAALFRCVINWIGRNQMNAAKKRVELAQRFRVLQRVIESLSRQPSCFRDELSIKRLAPAKFRSGSLTDLLIVLRHPGGRD